ncbi:MAG TPA: hypothetical protein VNR88_00140 [Hyphomicrobium sp.]|nr:hypothetical protein [Hyphomicrobium sp.]
MLLDMIATVILVGMMLVPILNVFAGVIVGAGLAGLPGAMAGLFIALTIMGAERLAVAYAIQRETRRARVVRRTRVFPRASGAQRSRRRGRGAIEHAHAGHLLRGEPYAGTPLMAGGVGVRPSPKSPVSISY